MTEADSVHSTPRTNTPLQLPAESAGELCLPRRNFLAQAAVAAGGLSLGLALPLPPSATAPADPIFELINAHRAAHAAHTAAMHEGNRLEKMGGDWTEITEGPCHAENVAFDILLGATASTVPGLLAKLAYLRAIAEGEEAWMLDEREGGALLLIESFTTSLKNIGLAA